ncbi:MAG: hypothetical protein PHQ36_00655 [Anaerolineales bacterium]|nr:hypothetical protein [Anaerolineales bacterium]
MMSQDFECRISVNLLLEAAHRLFSYDKVPLALTLLHVVLEQYPDHAKAHNLYEMFTGKSAPVYPVNRSHHLYHDAEANMFVVADKVSGNTASFKTFEEAQEYLRRLE